MKNKLREDRHLSYDGFFPGCRFRIQRRRPIQGILKGMKRFWCRWFIFLICLHWVIQNETLFAQPDSNQILFKSRPIGAVVELKGIHTIIGQTPLFIKHELNGPYQVRVNKSGFESWQKTVFFNPLTTRQFDISLTPKTRWKAVLRSMLIPGWGQCYSERPIKGVVVGATFGIALCGAIINSIHYQNKVTAYNDALAELNQTNLPNAEYQRLWQGILKKQEQAEGAFKRQQKWFWITTGLFIGNLVDAFILFPALWGNNSDGHKFTLTVEPGSQFNRMAVAINF